jgi:aminoglycoside phosphotransferase (APT) family kinase protein
MFFSKEIQILTEEAIGEIYKILPIEKGFSTEKKWQVIAEKGMFLLRSSQSNILERKKEEFDLMSRLYRQGVKCNKPVHFFESTDKTTVYSLFSYLPGNDAEACINDTPRSQQYEMGVRAGKDLKSINSVTSDTRTWYKRKWKKHNHYLKMYGEIDYRFDEDKKVQRFIEKNYNQIDSGPDLLQHDDFHLGNIIVNNNEYGGVLDFNRYDWGDPLHEFVKLEWFTWPVSKDFAKGQVKGYFKEHGIGEDDCLKISIYTAMSIFSTAVWTLKFFPETIGNIEQKITSILKHYRYFEKTIPDWAI